MKKYTVLDFDFIECGWVYASTAQSALQTAKLVYPRAIAPMVCEATK